MNNTLIIDFCGELSLSNNILSSINKIPFKVEIVDEILFIKNAEDDCDSVTFTQTGVNCRGSQNNIGMLFGTFSIGVCGIFNNIRIAPQKICFNDYECEIKNGVLYVNGIKFNEDKGFYEDKISKDADFSLKDDEYIDYKIPKNMIFDNIIIKKRSSIFVHDDKNISEEELNCKVEGSGDLIIDSEDNENMIKIEKLVAIVQGTGDIGFDHIQSGDFDAIVQGTGDIVIRRNCKIEKLSLLVQGTGDITVSSKLAKHIDKSIVRGTGDITLV